MSLVLAGLLITLSGLMVAIFAFTSSGFDNFPELRNAFMGIGLVFAILGVIIRIYALKLEKKHKK